MVPLIVPTPTALNAGIGGYRLQPGTRIQATGQAVQAAELLRTLIGPATGLELLVDAQGGEIELSVAPERTDLGSEGYHLHIDDVGVTIVAADGSGLRWAVQTLRQLLPAEAYSTEQISGVDWVFPAVDILDVPRFSWRGLMIDLVRWFRPLSEVRRLIELAAVHKLNVVHLHLTDDQGWRFECLRYPRLTTVGAWRPESLVGPGDDEVFDGIPHGGFYTQADLRELVTFATALGVTLVPEVDVPGHMTAAIASYPELGNHPDRQLPVGTRWGVIEEVLNVEEATVEFVKNVLDELIDVFPSPYINVGGDECPRVEWAASTRAQDRKRELGLSTDDQLQAWFIAELGRHLALRGRKLIGWDEILDGGIAENATVLSWRGEGGGITAAKAGHDVVMAPEDRVYLDHYQADPSIEPWAPRGLNTLEAILGWEPVPVELTPAQATRVLGAQANVWVEYIPTREHLDYMVFPRLCALADVAWGSPERDPADFVQRLGDHLRRLDALGVGYRKP